MAATPTSLCGLLASCWPGLAKSEKRAPVGSDPGGAFLGFVQEGFNVAGLDAIVPAGQL